MIFQICSLYNNEKMSHHFTFKISIAMRPNCENLLHQQHVQQKNNMNQFHRLFFFRWSPLLLLLLLSDRPTVDVLASPCAEARTNPAGALKLSRLVRPTVAVASPWNSCIHFGVGSVMLGLLASSDVSRLDEWKACLYVIWDKEINT